MLAERLFTVEIPGDVAVGTIFIVVVVAIILVLAAKIR
jgi:hypothetical protein